ncbi:MAG: DUF4440 domain-containing protein [Acidobacteria bacterium]|nr:DUF4440 domain-containing protein [Acidobacteriota bacterium]
MSGLSQHAQQAIMAVQQQWLDHELAGDMMGLLALCVQDVVWLPPNVPALRDKNAVAAWLVGLPKNRIRRIEIANLQIDGSEGLAYKVADFTVWLDTGEQGSSEPVRGSHVWLLREVSPGCWRVAVVAWSIAGSMRAPA